MPVLPSWAPVEWHSLSPTQLCEVLHGQGAEELQASQKQLLAMGQEGPPTRPLPRVPAAPSSLASECLRASDLGHVVVGEQALLAAQSPRPPARRICGDTEMVKVSQGLCSQRCTHRQRRPGSIHVLSHVLLMKIRCADVPHWPPSRRTHYPVVRFCCPSPVVGPVGSSGLWDGPAAGLAGCDVGLRSDDSNPVSHLFFPDSPFTCLTPHLTVFLGELICTTPLSLLPSLIPVPHQ